MSELMKDGQVARPFTGNSFQLKINQFYDTMSYITLQHLEATTEERRQIIADTLRFEEFCEKLTDLFGDGIQVKDLKTLFRKISNNPDAKLDWCELFGYESPSLSVSDEPMMSNRSEGEVFAIEYRTRAGNVSLDKRRLDTTRSITYCKHLDTYIATSKKGIVTHWNMKLENIYHMEIPDTAWLIHCIYLPHLKKLLCVTERGLVLWDHKADVKTMEFFMIRPFEHSIVCMAYVPSSDTNCERVVLGDDQGYVTMVTLTQLDLVRKQGAVKKLPGNHRVMININTKKLAVPILKRKVHTDWTLKLLYVEELQSVISCSPSAKCSLVVEGLNNLFNADIKVRSANVHRGVNTFAYSTKSSIVATAGCDKIIRIWHPTVLNKPTGKLIGHLFTVVGIQINEKEQRIISLSSARVIRVWCMNTMTNLQIFTDHDDRAGDTRINVLYYDQRHEVLFTGSGVIDRWSLARTVLNKLITPQSHERPILQVVHNSTLNQFISLCSEPIIRVWSCESRNLVYQIVSPHSPNIDVTCMCVCNSGYRLATGAIDGSLKVWDIGAGQEIKSYFEKVLVNQTAEDTHHLSVVSLLYLPYTSGKPRLLVASGWQNQIRIYSDSDSESSLPLLTTLSDSFIVLHSFSRTNTIVSSFNSHAKLPPIGMTLTTGHKGRTERVLEKDEICCSSLLVESEERCSILVGTHTGSIIVWDGATHSITNVFRLPKISQSSNSDIFDSQPDKRVNAVGVIKHTKATVHNQTSRDSIITANLEISLKSLPPKNNKEFSHKSVIISVHEDAGIRLWSTSGKLLCETVAMTRRTGVSVTAFCVDDCSNVLYTGDLLGYITMWKVSEFVEGLSDSIQQVVSWRAHTGRVSSILLLPHKDNLLVYTASADGSVRIWFDQTCRYLGYLGQGRPILIPSSTSFANGNVSPQFPCDITEQPIFSSTRIVKPKRSQSSNLEVPLVFKRDRKLSPLRHTTDSSLMQIADSSITGSTPGLSVLSDRPGRRGRDSDTKFFKSLIKPKQYNTHLERELPQISDFKGSTTSGFVFRALPMYRISTPRTIPYPQSSLRSIDHTDHRPMDAAGR